MPRLVLRIAILLLAVQCADVLIAQQRPGLPLSQPNPRIARLAVQALGRSEGESAVPTLVGYLDSDDEMVRREAASALAYWGLRHKGHEAIADARVGLMNRLSRDKTDR